MEESQGVGRRAMNREEMLRRLEDGEDALELSIEKWEDIVEHLSMIDDIKEYDKALEDGGDNCALCCLFRDRVNVCVGCPVSAAGGYKCNDTPYTKFDKAEREYDCGEMLKYALEELEFLKGLRKEE